jgi:hypothetical protein
VEDLQPQDGDGQDQGQGVAGGRPHAGAGDDAGEPRGRLLAWARPTARPSTPMICLFLRASVAEVCLPPHNRRQVRNERAMDALTAELDDLEEEMQEAVGAAIKGRSAAKVGWPDVWERWWWFVVRGGSSCWFSYVSCAPSYRAARLLLPAPRTASRRRPSASGGLTATTSTPRPAATTTTFTTGGRRGRGRGRGAEGRGRAACLGAGQRGALWCAGAGHTACPPRAESEGGPARS